MAASFIRLGLGCRRLKTFNLSNEKISILQDFHANFKVGCFSSIEATSFALISIFRTAGFHSSVWVPRRKQDETKRRDFLLKLLDKKKRETVEVWRNMSVEDLAKQLKKHPKELLEILHTHISEGYFYRSKNDLINNFDILRDVVKFMGKAPVMVPSRHAETMSSDLDAYPRPPPNPEDLKKRAPIVTIMGHVDHGKTTLLDYLRNANVVSSEFGGITQHIGAFSVKLGEESVTFIDTPGHAAFTSMRSRGANATDIVVLVVAADDGVMEQTIESIRMAQEANATIIVAINKIDKPNANIERTEKMLAEHELYTENMGGDIQAVPISALNGTNVDTLVEAILLQSELMELKGDPSGFAEGVIVESKQESHKGKLATAIIQRGTLRKGAHLVAGVAYAKVRLMFNESGNQISHAPPSMPVEMMGWKDLPAAGEILLEVESERRAHQVINYRKSQAGLTKALDDQKVVAEKTQVQKKAHYEKRRAAYERGYLSLKEQRQKVWVPDGTPKVSVIIKGDVDGSVEAILDVLETYDSSDVPLDIVHYGVGDVSPNDIEIASTFGAIVYSFNVKTPPAVKEEAKKQKVSIRNVNVIYRLVDDLKNELGKKMPEVDEVVVLGEANVIQQFDVNEKRKKLVVAGLRVTKGEIIKSEKVKLIREEDILYDGSISSLRHVKNEVNSIKSGSECGLMLEDATIPVKLGDKIICYKTNQVKKALEWDPGF